MKKKMSEWRIPSLRARTGNASGDDAPSADVAPHIWRSRISWRITLTVFAVILLVQGAALYYSKQNFEMTQLAQLRAVARTAIIQHLAKITPAKLQKDDTPLSLADANRIMSTSPVRGLAIYGLDDNQIISFGEETTLPPQGLATYWTSDKDRYEVVYTPSDLDSPFNVVAAIDSSGIPQAVTQYVEKCILVFFLMAGLVTSILMLALGQWLLEPVLTLRKNLLNAAENPKEPEILGAGKEGRDEVGVTLRIANSLIRKNAWNIKQMERQTEERIHRLAYFDTLTGLPNRTLFMEKLEETIKRKVKGENRRLSVFFIDIDHFRDLNNTMGHEIGDRFLEAVGRRLLGAAPADAVVARINADLFAVMTLLDYADHDGSATLERLLGALSAPVNILQEEFKVRVSVGACTSPYDGHDARTLMKNADIALSRAKEDGNDTVRYYSDDLDLAVSRRFRLLGDLREALQGDQLQLYFQPQFDLATGAIVGSEALLRWHCPDNSPEGSHLVPLEEFVQVAEQTGLIIPLGEWVLRHACKAGREWQDKGGAALSVAVNITSMQFHHGDIVDTVARILKETGFDARLLELEITESVFMEDMPTSIETLRQLHELGVRLAVDDFGTGYSSLAALRSFPVDRLKIDPSFVRNALINEEDAAIVKTIITLGHSLGVKVMAEGVETAYHLAFLKDVGCDEAQGFQYSRPLPSDKFREYAAAYGRGLLRNSLHIVGGKAS
ncbi:MAG: EAL domain-containing protein [Alphaproteobacteria bacterium]|nr:EAL domain-containing protein [Alphaproteobacteria bacterium]MDE2336876.1 EAL domain-containing protein [Alphaproteobacteria bacterium]